MYCSSIIVVLYTKCSPNFPSALYLAIYTQLKHELIISSCFTWAYVKILSTWEVWRALKRLELLSATIIKICVNCCFDHFDNMSKRSKWQLTQIFIIVARVQSSTCQCLHDYIFLPHSSVFVLKLRESLLKSFEITFKKIVKSILRCQKTIDSPKNSFWKNWLCKEWFAHAIACTARADDNNSHLFSLLSVNKFKSFLLNLPNKTHGRLWAVPLESVESKLGRTGESEMAERETGERREEEGPLLPSRLLPTFPLASCFLLSLASLDFLAHVTMLRDC